jgi:hypothetical protein
MRLIPTALVLSLACGSAFAQQAIDPQQPKIEPGLLSAYTEYDVNGDGNVATSEFVALLPPELQAAGRSCDLDGNGGFDQTEYDACTAAPGDLALQPR